ncbi:glycerol-3-phosphate acyltransferase [Deinococcus yavapaiensis]|uniref:Acyl-phosphate glycerol 3-phosphate acyltransferase n=1 Tax=Deinococcus yavapaiensis KR-236 TaxID=694435 RepID=A0A318S198_9DEIO|nr:glycerol-3-phosphate acyltransferase [Deinococcus yavapaiensis]PYE51095.1 acyl-phosphate glycerol 3-phosphate acyltransferase [Deinococcus yavapaiensis KR-236]
MPALLGALVIAIAAYLLGSLSFGILYSRLRGGDIRERDLPGGSGIYRQYGLAAAILVVALDMLKGVLAVLFAYAVAPDFTWLACAFVVLGHTYPVFYRFDGGGGIAPLLGALAVVAPLPLAVMLIVALAFMPLYTRFLQPTFKIYPIPAATVLAVPLGLLLAARFGGVWDLLAGGLAMFVRALQLLRKKPKE